MGIIVKVLISFLLISAAYATLYSVGPDFKVGYEVTHNQLAHLYYDQKLNEDGLNYLNAYASSQKSLLDQHRGVGFLQGYVTYKQIFSAYNNLNSFKIKSASVNVKLQTYLDKQLEFIRKMSQTYPQDLYWQTVFAYLEQCRYAYFGYLQRIHQQSRNDMYIGFSQFYYLTSVGDFRQLLPALNQQKTDLRDKSCTVYVRQEGDDFIVSHSTMNYYTYMLRIYKMYSFPSRDARVGSQSINFSARPADFNSKDDFYVASSGLKILETSLLNFRDSNYPELKPESVPCWLRATVATNLARNGQEWINYFTRYNSGTHNNQWLIIDRSQLKLKKNAVVFLEQAFSLIKIHDMTSKLDSLGFVASYNVPFDQQVYDKLGYEEYPYSFDNDRRLQILKQYHPKMKTVQDMKYWLLSNEEEDVRQGIAPREDLYSSSPQPYGIIDCKIITPSTEKQNYYWAINGPSTSNGRFHQFSWSQFPSVLHMGMPNSYNFTWQQVYINQQAEFYTKNKNLAMQ